MTTTPSRRVLAVAASFVIVSCSLPLIAQQSKSERISFRVTEASRLSFDLSSDGRTIVFDLLGQLWLIPANGGEAQAITNAVRDTAEDLDPSFSPGGRRVLFKAERDGLRGLWLLEPGARAPRQITQLPNQFAEDGGASWSPDGKRVAFARVMEGDSVGARPRSIIMLRDFEAGATRQLSIEGLPKPDVRDPAWTPDGQRIVFVAGNASAGSGGRIWIVDRSGGKATPVTDTTIKGFAPAFAPNGRSIAFFAPDSSGRFQLWVQDDATAERAARPKRLTDLTDVAPTRVRWTADGSTLLYSANGRLWRIPAAGGRATEIPFTARLSFDRPRRTLPRARFPLPGEQRRARAFMGLAISPDGRLIGAIALGKLWIIPVGEAARAIAGVPQTARYMAWSADGAEVAWSAGDWSQEDLFATTVATGRTRRLTSLPGREVLPAYSPDGRHLAFAHAAAAGKNTLRLILTGGRVITDTTQTKSLGAIDLSWTASNVAPPVWSPDSRGLVMDAGWNSNAPTRGLMLKLSGGRDTLTRFPDAPTFMQWTRDTSVIFVRHDRLWQARFDSSGMLGQPRAMGDAPAIYASAARDGTVLFISEGGLRLRSPDGSERRLGWPISYTPPVAAPLLIRNVRIVSGADARASSPNDVLIQRGRITRIAKAGSVTTSGARVLDAGGRFAIPGLMDLHAHDYRPDLLPGFLYFGVMTLRDQGADIAPLIAYDDAIAAGFHPGPRVMYGGFQFYSDWPFDEEQGRGIEPEADKDHVRRSVALAEAFGAQHIKTRTFRRWDINARMIREAHKRGMRATGHCASPLPLVAAGMDAQEHIDMCNSRVGAYYLSDIYMYDDMIRLFREAGISVVPTITYLSLPARLSAQPKLLESDAELAPFLPPAESFNWMISMPSEGRKAYARAAQAARETSAKLARGGVVIGTGTDVWQVPTAVHMEMEDLVAGGLSPAAAIRAATSDAARIIGAERDIGSIERGKLADIVLLDSNPLENIRNTRRIWAVIQAGRIVDRGSIRREAQAQAARRPK